MFFWSVLSDWSLVCISDLCLVCLIWAVWSLSDLISCSDLFLWSVWSLSLICLFSCSDRHLFCPISCCDLSDVSLNSLISLKCFSVVWSLSLSFWPVWSLSAESLYRRRRIWVKRLGEWSQVCRICRSCRLKSSCSPPRWLLSSPPLRPTDAFFSSAPFHLSLSVYHFPNVTILIVMILISDFWFPSSCLSFSWAFLSSKTLSYVQESGSNNRLMIKRYRGEKTRSF